jgi:hypothetical protein
MMLMCYGYTVCHVMIKSGNTVLMIDRIWISLEIKEIQITWLSYSLQWTFKSIEMSNESRKSQNLSFENLYCKNLKYFWNG